MVTREEYAESGQVSGLPHEVGVYTQGKVGSKAVLATLRDMFDGDEEAGEHMYVWDYRRSDPEGVLEHQKVQGTRRRLLSDDPEIAQFLLDNPEREMHVTSVVREPIAINLSSFFYNFAAKNPDTDIHDVDDEEIIDRLVAGESFSHPTFHLEWFDIEVKPMTGINVYAEGAFHRAKGAKTYEGVSQERLTKMLIMRLEDIKRVGSSALAHFYERPERPITKVNSGDEQAYAERYAAFKQSARLPAGWVSGQLNSEYASYFYSDAERSAFAQKWSGTAALIR